MEQKKKIWLSLAHMGGKEETFIHEAFLTNWVVPLGPNVDAFERSLEKYLHIEEGRIVALSSGTAALHLALIQLGIAPGDFVLCQSFTFSASANPIAYLGATPVFIDSECDTWNMSPIALEKGIEFVQDTYGKLPKAIIPVHLYGMPANMREILEVANRYGIPIVEDSAEALGSKFEDRYCGTFGTFGAISFNGNKIITTSGGGALICPSVEVRNQVLNLATQARDNAPYYQHSKIGYNYRLSNVSAGIGRGQMLVLDDHIARRKAIRSFYEQQLGDIDGISFQKNPSLEYDSIYWLTTMLIDSKITGVTPEILRRGLEEEEIESRPLWKPMHLQPVFSKSPFIDSHTKVHEGQDSERQLINSNSVSEQIFDQGLCLPSGSSLTDEDLMRVVNTVKRLIRK